MFQNLYYKKEKLTFLSKIKLIFSLLFKNFNPVIKFDNGVEFDLKNKKVILNNPLEIKSKENITITSEKHLILNSGKSPEHRPGYYYSIWENSSFDEYGNPIRLHMYFKNNIAYLLPIEFDNNGNIIAPKGYSLNKIKTYPRRQRYRR